MALTKDAILKAGALPQERVDLPEMGGHVIVRGLTGRERDAYEAGLVTRDRKGRSEQNLDNVRARLVVLTCFDDEGARIFGPADVAAVGDLPAKVLDRLFDVARRLSGMTEEDVKELGKPSPADRPAA